MRQIFAQYQMGALEDELMRSQAQLERERRQSRQQQALIEIDRFANALCFSPIR